jgi:uncharacterized damage-inducible protein DinB
MNEILRDNLVKSLKGGNAFVPINNALENVDPKIRNKKANENTHSVWEELEHMRIAQEDIINYMLDANWKSPEWPAEYWPKEKDNISDTEWNNSLNGFLSDLDKAITIAKDENIDLLSIIPHTKEHTYLREILILIEHNAYHTGKILDIRKSLGDWK